MNSKSNIENLPAVRCALSFPASADVGAARFNATFANPIAIHAAYELNAVKAALKAAEATTARGHWAVGFVSYEAATGFDSALQTAPADGTTPLVWFAEFTAPAIVEAAEPTGTFALGQWQSDTDAASFTRAVEAVRADIIEGRFYQVNFTTRLAAGFAGDALALYRALQKAQPDGYQMFIDAGDFKVLSVSPELFFSLKDGVITTQPMKGTAPRGTDAAQDAALAHALTQSPKERAENVMIVDLLRNDVSRIAREHTVKVPYLCALTALPTVWQMTSTIQATIKNDVSVCDIFAALFPCGSITGAPKVEAMKAISTLENAPRGLYCGALGYMAPHGAACFNVAIRSVWLRGSKAQYGVGSGITHDATVAGEAAELIYKARFLHRASKPFSLFETMRLDNGAPHLLAAHIARLKNSARHFQFMPLIDADIAHALAALQPQHAIGVWRVKLSASADGKVSATAAALEAVPQHAMVQLASTNVSQHDEFLQHKTTRRETYEAHAPAANSGIWDTLLWNEAGELTEFTRANVVLELDGARYTPPLSCGLLNGVMREQWLAQGVMQERVLHRHDLNRATKIWWINSLRGAFEVTLQTR